MTRNPRRAGPTLRVPDVLLRTLAELEGGALDAGPVVRRIAAGVARLNRGLTRERAGFGGYLRDAELRAAYRAYYLCTNAPKLWPILDRLRLRGVLSDGGRALELGCGPGTGCVGLGLWAAANGQRWELHPTDTLPEAVGMATDLLRRLRLEASPGARVDLNVTLPAAAKLGGPFDLIVCMNVLNEIEPRHDARLVGELRSLLAPGGLLVAVEPAARAESRRVLGFRDAAVAAGWHVVAPCPHAGACPALATPDDWCHGEWHFERPAFVRAVDRETGLLREVLKATWMVLSPMAPGADAAAPTGNARVMGAREDRKGISRVTVCMGGKLRPLELQTRDRTPENADFFELTRHDLARIEGPACETEMPAGKAIRLGADDVCERVSESA